LDKTGSHSPLLPCCFEILEGFHLAFSVTVCP
jgi:hypothetical protein